MLNSGVRPSGSHPLGNEDIILPSDVTSLDLRGIHEKYQITPENPNHSSSSWSHREFDSRWLLLYVRDLARGVRP